MAGSRVAYRLFCEGRLFFTRRPMTTGQVPILIDGGGTDAEIFLRSLDAASHYSVGMLDDDRRTAQLRGVPALSAIADAEAVVESFSDAGDRPRRVGFDDFSLRHAGAFPVLAVVKAAASAQDAAGRATASLRALTGSDRKSSWKSPT